MSDDVPDQRGRRYVVTGATGGIGATAGRALSAAGAEVVLAVRDLDRGAAVAATFPGPTEVLALDVSRLDSVRAFGRDWSGRLDGLLNNAGVMATPFARTPDGSSPSSRRTSSAASC
ncbi:SDR family NAD(P)-dependent oxidoreductase [Curtobacterium flaccumfaciens]|uniref:SDR family NAD(P)-dependent oxidoreductase n=1 Tax=Curtobacterium flaccumfaciens TaxID=2035 RepID=UPI001BE01F2C|nr:SDR family NAD(P)-dependent oxidoreductase [Curtobacterium flaccumfaciens]MBT1583380.1 SDR family NAD(P)-dependent oxidoreductase [Curtobacterium flaccumfaciens pv. flaccumfaciens]MCX2797943.1 SDR family NAD(P)-dependent oxidoreductase [Curtobacterium flaccumfaciens pv. flaccumfaciens]